jgi:hypothetical protein
VASDELAYLLDLHLFLGRPFNVSQTEAASKDDDFPDGVIGRIPEVLLDEEHSELKVWHETENDLVSGKKYMYGMREAQTQLQAGAVGSFLFFSIPHFHLHVGCLATKPFLLH